MRASFQGNKQAYADPWQKAVRLLRPFLSKRLRFEPSSRWSPPHWRSLSCVVTGWGGIARMVRGKKIPEMVRQRGWRCSRTSRCMRHPAYCRCVWFLKHSGP